MSQKLNSKTKVIFLRGLPGTGKTIVAKHLACFLTAKHIHVDKYKLQSSAKTFVERCSYAYLQAIYELQQLIDNNEKYIIIEEILNDRKFAKDLQKTINKRNLKSYWFILTRSLEELINVAANGKRKTNNTIKDFINLQKELDNNHIKDEIMVENENIDKTISIILERIQLN